MFGVMSESCGSHSARKRRRPALSCVECRRRKVKCDRNIPCNHCRQSKTSACIYKEPPSVASNRQSVNQNRPLAPATLDNDDTSFQSKSYDTSSNIIGYVPKSPKVAIHTIRNAVDALQLEKGSSNSTPLTSLKSAPSLKHNDIQELVNRTSRLNYNVADALIPTEKELANLPYQQGLGVCFATFGDVIVQDGEMAAQLRTKYFSKSDETPIQDLKGQISKTRFFGQSHWMHAFKEFQFVCHLRSKEMLSKHENDGAANEVKMLLEKCKNLARKAKAERPHMWHTNPDFRDYVPERALADKLIDHYFRTMESTHRILHIPHFKLEYEQYWVNPLSTPTTSVVKILLVMAIGACFHQEEDHMTVRAMAQQWVYSAQSWVGAPFEKSRLNLSGLQVQCLLLLARQTNGVGGDVIWIGAGALLRTAFQMGFHRDPNNFSKMSIMHKEMRRRLWATVLELCVQTSLDSGMPPLITTLDYDTAPPSNIDDCDFSEVTTVQPASKPESMFAQASIQIQLFKTLGTRIRISQLINNFRIDPSYEEILSLGAEIGNSIKEATTLLSSYPAHLPHPTILQRNLLNLVLRRFMLALHRPSALKFSQDSKYYFSRKVCLDTAVTILSLSGFESGVVIESGKMDDFTRLKVACGGFYKEIFMAAGVILACDLSLMIEDEIKSGLYPSASGKLARAPLIQAVKDLEPIYALRILFGDNQVKAHLVVSAVVAQLECLENCTDVEQGIMAAIRKSARYSLELLKQRTQIVNTPSDSDSGEQTGNTESNTESTINTDFDFMNVEQDAGFDFLMQDASPNFDFDLPDSWLFPEGEMNNAPW